MTAASRIVWLDDAAAPGDPLLGGKFSSLATSMAAGYAVPPGFGITTVAYRDFLDAAGLVGEARRVRQAVPGLALADIQAETAHLTETIMTADLPLDLEATVRKSYAELEVRTACANVPVAVRSSGESEDLAGASFAGQYETYLWISGADDVLKHMRMCWAGMFSETVLSYQRDGDTVITQGDIAMCVGVQQMVQARSAGVMFTLDPLTGDRSKIVFEACWGLGEGVVKGDITPSLFVIDKVTFDVLKRQVATQTEEYRFKPDAGTVGLAPIEPSRQEMVCLSDENIQFLAKLGKRIEADRGAPQDIEWAIGTDDDLWVLQVRPETVWSRKSPSRPIAATKSPVDHVLSRLSGVKVAASNSDASKS